MTDFLNKNLGEAQQAMTPHQRPEPKLERADLARCGRGHSLNAQIGHRMRKVFVTPETHVDEFDALLKQISSLLP